MRPPASASAVPSRTPDLADEPGIALILVLLFTTFLSALGIGLMLAVFMDRLATGNMAGSVAMLYAAQAGLEIAARDLTQVADWNAALSGAQRSSFVDGAPGGVRALPGGSSIDLTAATNLLNCAQPTPCSATQLNANSRERPWGANNARWQLFAYGPVSAMADFERPAAAYLAVWLADDGREQDGDPVVDAPLDEPGHGIVRVRAEAYGRAGFRRAIEAELARVCPDGGGPCLPGIRVQSWQELRR